MPHQLFLLRFLEQVAVKLTVITISQRSLQIHK
jgi:hypothetical protein